MVHKKTIHARKLRKTLIKAFYGKCWFCGSIEHLEFFHIIPTELNGRGRGFLKRMYDIAKNPTCYGLACKDCHYLYDNGILEDNDINV